MTRKKADPFLPSLIAIGKNYHLSSTSHSHCSGFEFRENNLTLTMTPESQAIEVEVVEVDGMVPSHQAESQDPANFVERETRGWQSWQASIPKWNARWWPLWMFLGIVAVFLLLTFGIVIGVVLGVYQICRSFFRSVFK